MTDSLGRKQRSQTVSAGSTYDGQSWLEAKVAYSLNDLHMTDSRGWKRRSLTVSTGPTYDGQSWLEAKVAYSLNGTYI